jgi:hypothetical protein
VRTSRFERKHYAACGGYNLLDNRVDRGERDAGAVVDLFRLTADLENMMRAEDASV